MADDIFEIILNGSSLDLENFVNISRHYFRVQADSTSLGQIQKSYRFIQEAESKNPDSIYGMNTGLGSLYRERVPSDQQVRFSRNVILSHACGVGAPFETEIVRGAMTLLVNNFLSGHSGIRAILPQTVVQMLNKNVHPIVPSQGSVGASGDLAPLAHVALVVSRDPVKDNAQYSGQAEYQQHQLSGYEAMQQAGIERVILGPKEGLSIVNGTHFTSALLALAVWDTKILLRSIDIIAAMSLEALCGVSNAFDERVHQLRPHPGQIASAKNIRTMIAGSKLIDSAANVVQDPYAFRCIPQIHGAARDVLDYAQRVIEVELNAVTDSPLIFIENEDEGTVLSCGNFHAEPLGYASDALGIALAGLGTATERRAYRLLDGKLNRGLPSFLVDNAGVNTGFMIVQYTAASLASENKVLSHPSTVDSITCSENQEDHVSMATTAARKLRNILNNVTQICAIELLFAAQALDIRQRQSQDSTIAGKGTMVAWQAVRSTIPFLSTDRVLTEDIEKAASLITSGKLLKTVEEVIGQPVQ